MDSRRRRPPPPRECRRCGRPIAWIRGLRWPVNPVHVVLLIDGYECVSGYDKDGLEFRGEIVPEGTEGRTRWAWLKHQCDPLDLMAQAARGRMAGEKADA